MVDLVKEWDPMFFEKVGLGPIDGDDAAGGVVSAGRGRRRCASPRSSMRGSNGRWSRLRDWSADAEEIVADAVRSMFGLTADEMADDEAIDRVMNPARNRYRVDMLNVSYHSPLMRALHHANYVFEKRLSHTADSQDQRHRMVPASRPLMTFADTESPDYVTPRLIAANPRAQAVYDQAMREAWAAKNRLLALGVPLEYALYVLPNAKALRFVESGSFLALQHKWTLRTCFNAQEEIYLASMDEIEQVRAAASADRPPPRPAVRDPQQDRVAALHRGHALLRRAGVARFPGRSASAVAAANTLRACNLAAWLVHSLHRQRRGPRLPRRHRHLSSIDYRAAFFWLALQVLVDCHRRRAGPRFRSRSGCPGSAGQARRHHRLL